MSLSFFCAAFLALTLNHLTGPIPTELARLTSLRALYLCKFATISSSGLDTIRLLASFLQFISSTLVVAINQLTGPIPTELGRLTGLEYLGLGKFATISSSELVTIRLLASFLQFISSTLVVDENQLTGPIPSELGRLTSLEYLSIGKFATISRSELVTIRLLASFLQFISYTVVVGDNQLTGPIPTELGRLTSLETLYLCKFATISSSE
jgi:hypothetical protein